MVAFEIATYFTIDIDSIISSVIFYETDDEYKLRILKEFPDMNVEEQARILSTIKQEKNAIGQKLFDEKTIQTIKKQK